MEYTSRRSLFHKTGARRLVEEETKRAFAVAEDKIWRKQLENSPHGAPWHTSFHASSFPGNDERACGRKALYTLMDIPGKEATPRKLRGQAEVGKAVEMMLVERFGMAGVLLSADADSEFQTNFTDEEFWLTGNCDIIMVPEGWDRPHVVEVKTKAHDQILEMQRMERGPDAKHINQVKTYIGFANEESHRWPEFNPCLDGSIFYLSRDDPSTTWEFFYDHETGFMSEGRAKLGEWQASYLKGELPAHPFGGKEWSKEPCLYCPFKKNVCKPDELDEVTRLRQSHGVEWAREVTGEYDYEAKRNAVLQRWNAGDLEDDND